MTAYQQPRFSVPTGQRDPATCEHGWPDAKGNCTFCGTPLPPPEPPEA